jgi:hypothetical protein
MPSTKSSTFTTPMLSDVLTFTETLLVTLALSLGAVIMMVGVVTSNTLFTITEIETPFELPSGSIAVAVNV